MTIYIDKHIQKKIISVIHKHLPQCIIYVFGSRALGTHSPGSDIDLALDAGHPISDNEIRAIKNDLCATTIPMEFDIVDIKNIQEELKIEIKHKGKILWKP